MKHATLHRRTGSGAARALVAGVILFSTVGLGLFLTRTARACNNPMASWSCPLPPPSSGSGSGTSGGAGGCCPVCGSPPCPPPTPTPGPTPPTPGPTPPTPGPTPPTPGPPPPPPPTGFPGPGCTSCASGHGAPRLEVSAHNQQVFITDIPLWYQPGVGPKVSMKMVYDSRDPRVIDSTPEDPPAFPDEIESWTVGRKWTFLYQSYITFAHHDLGEGTWDEYYVFMPHYLKRNFTLDHDNVYKINDTYTDQTAVKLIVAADGNLWFKLRQTDTFEFEPDPFTPNRFRLKAHYGANPIQPPTTCVYDGNDGRLLKVVAADGKEFPLTYDANGRIASIADPFGRSIVFNYSGDDLVGLADMDGQAFTYTYDAGTGKVTSITRNDNRTTSISYDTGDPETIFVTDPDGKTTSYAFGGRKSGRPNIVTDPDGKVILKQEVGEYVITWQEDGEGRRTSFGYAEEHSTVLASKTAPNGIVTRYTRDAHGYLSAVEKLKNVDDGQGGTTEQLLSKKTWETTYYADVEPMAPSQVIEKTLDTDTGAVLAKVTRDYTRFDNGTPDNPADDYFPIASEVRLISDNGTPNDDTDDIVAETRWSYDTLGRLTQVLKRVGPGEDPGDFRTVKSYTYDETTGRLTAEIDALGNTVTYTWNARGLVESRTEPGNRVTLYTYGDLDRVTRTDYPDSTFETWAYDCCGVASHTDRTGGSETFSRTDGKLVNATYTTPGGVKVRDDSYTYDARKRLTQTTDNLGFTRTFEYDNANRRTAVTDALGNTTRYEYDNTGRLSRITDPLGHQTFFEYDDLGRQIAKKAELEGETVTLETRTYDNAGRLASTTDALGNTTTYTYDMLGRILQTTTPDGTIATTAYDRLGNVTSRTDPHDPNDPNPPTTTMTYDDLDRLVSVTKPDGTIASYQYHQDFPRLVTAITFQADAQADPVTIYTAAYDANGRKTSETRQGITVTYTYTADGRPLRTTYADGTFTENTYDGRLVTAVKDRAGNTATFAYDGLGRRTTVTDARGAVTTTVYRANTRKPASVTDPLGNVTTYSYDAAGRRITTVFPGTEPEGNRTQTRTYDQLGRLTRVDGARTYPISYEYDLAGHMTAMIDGEGNRTEWAYDARGRMIRKTYADGTYYEYTYDAQGHLTSRTDAKAKTTDYAYDTAGRLTLIDYLDDPDVTTVYDAFGRKTSVTDAIGTWTWTYDGTSNRILTVSDPDGNVTSYEYDSSGRRTRMTLTVNGQLVVDQSYTYADGRMSGTSATVQADAGPQSVSASYARLAGSNLLDTVVLNNGTSDILTARRTWDLAGHLLSIVSENPQDTVASFTYQYDARGRRTKRTDLDGTYIDYSYDIRDQLTDAVRSGYPADKPYGDYPYEYHFGFDRIGNHLKQTRNGIETDGRYNNLNELVERVIAGRVRVQGKTQGVLPIGVKVDGNAAETTDVAADATAFKGRSRPIAKGQTGEKKISIVATDSNQPPKKTEQVRKVQLPPQNPIAFTYDANGNMLTYDNLWTYTWNNENRLVVAETPPNVGGASRRRLEFLYDHQGRRRFKKLYTWDEAGQTWVLSETHTTLYDGWNVICEQVTPAGGQPSNRYYVWGLDLSNTLQRAGGVGGLLAAHTPDGNWFYCYDGNGNVTTLVSTTDGSVIASYDYSPFGLTVAQSGPAADANTYRFSTKTLDQPDSPEDSSLGEGLYYYGFRYYNPTLGRWTSRDPLQETPISSISPLYRPPKRDHILRSSFDVLVTTWVIRRVNDIIVWADSTLCVRKYVDMYVLYFPFLNQINASNIYLSHKRLLLNTFHKTLRDIIANKRYTHISHLTDGQFVFSRNIAISAYDSLGLATCSMLAPGVCAGGCDYAGEQCVDISGFYPGAGLGGGGVYVIGCGCKQMCPVGGGAGFDYVLVVILTVGLALTTRTD